MQAHNHSGVVQPARRKCCPDVTACGGLKLNRFKNQSTTQIRATGAAQVQPWINAPRDWPKQKKSLFKIRATAAAWLLDKCTA
jgi:hypothetical protein